MEARESISSCSFICLLEVLNEVKKENKFNTYFGNQSRMAEKRYKPINAKKKRVVLLSDFRTTAITSSVLFFS